MSNISTEVSFDLTDENVNALTNFYIHVRNVSFNNTEADYPFFANMLDRLNVPFWVQNNLAVMAKDKQVYYKNGLYRIVSASCNLDWRPHVSR